MELSIGEAHVRQRNNYMHARFAIRELYETLDGRVVMPSDTDYHQARTVFSGSVDCRPAAIVRARSVNDVRDTIRVAGDSLLPLAVRSGGHSVHSSVDDGIVLDLRELKSLDVDVNNRTAWAGTGLTAAEYSARVGAFGLATGFGDTGSVGIGGITLGGGIGYLTRKYGLTIDSLIAADVVTADGRVRRVDANSHPELFWAIRGGGGNFGVATRFQFRLHPVDRVIGGILLLPATPAVVADFVALADDAPEELTTIANVMPAPPMPAIPAEHHGKLVLLAFMCYAGDNAAGARVLGQFRRLATPVADMLRPMRYPEIYPPDDPSFHPTAVGRTMFIKDVNRGVAKTIVESVRASDAPMRVVQMRVLGGAMARVPSDATAFAHRHGRILVNVAAFYTNEMDRDLRKRWVSDVAGALHQGENGAYVNFLSNEGSARVRAAYPGSTWHRLAAIKGQYDPDNVFRVNENITPAVSEQRFNGSFTSSEESAY
jgi:FAD/FMN-containing dehydrogenase